MNRTRKLYRTTALGLLSAAFLATSAPGVIAADTSLVVPIKQEQSAPQDLPAYEEMKGIYKPVTGTVKEIHPFVNADGSEDHSGYSLTIEGENESVSIVSVTEDTYLFGGKKPVVGSEIKAFYDITLPMIMIYPPRYNVVAIASDLAEGHNVKVSVFDRNLVSADNDLKLNMDDSVKVLTPSGDVYEGDLEGRLLAVVYGASTRSIPAQTTPIEVTVLNDSSQEQEMTAEEAEYFMYGESAQLEYSVNGKAIDAPGVYVDENGTVMVPLRALAEELGYEVTVEWGATDKVIRLGHAISLSIGKDYYTYMRVAPISLGTAPLLQDGNTYVPLSFFKEVARLDQAEVVGGQIVLNNAQPAE